MIILLFFIIFVTLVMASLALHKGFKPSRWCLAAGPLGFIILLFMPSANAQGINEYTRKALVDRGNIVGGVLSAISVILFLIRLSLPM